MSFSSRQFAAAGVAVLALGAGAGPALAGSSSSSSAVKAKTPLVAEVATETSWFKANYSNPGCDFRASSACEVGWYTREQGWRRVRPVEAVHADSAQLPAKLEWVLGADLEAQGAGSLHWGQQNLIDRDHPQAQKRLIHAGVLDFRLANYYIADADSRLGVPHRALEVEPNRLVGKPLTTAEKKPLIADLSPGSLVANDQRRQQRSPTSAFPAGSPACPTRSTWPPLPTTQ